MGAGEEDVEQGAGSRNEAGAAGTSPKAEGGSGGSNWKERDESRECRVCLSSDDQNQMVAACACAGTQKWAHYGCLRQWVLEKRSLSCELCSTPYVHPYNGFLQSELAANPPRQPPTPPRNTTQPSYIDQDAQLALELELGGRGGRWHANPHTHNPHTVFVAGPGMSNPQTNSRVQWPSHWPGSRHPTYGVAPAQPRVGRASFWVACVIGAGVFVVIVIIALAAGLRHSRDGGGDEDN